MSKALKIAKRVFDVFFWIIIAVLVLTVILSVAAKIKGESVTFFGYSVYRVSSASMEPELMVGDVLLAKAVDDPSELKVGDIVTYNGSGSLSGKLITHEIIVAPHFEDGVLMLQTKGVANTAADAPISADRVVSVVMKKIEFLNPFYNFFFSRWGLLTIIALIILVFIDEFIMLAKAVTGHMENNEPKDINEIIGRMKAQAPASDEDNTENTNDISDEAED